MSIDLPTRRAFLMRAGFATSVLASGAIYAAQPTLTPPLENSDKKDEGEDVTPSEDLMREHGVLRRLLLAYDEFIRRLDAKDELNPDLLVSSADIIKRFVEDYHEKQEENYVFPRLQKAGKQIELVTVLLQQHAAGRLVTQQIRSSANAGGLRSTEARLKLRKNLYSFARMYRPHAAREDTVLFPAFRSVLSQNEYDSLGEQFERNETRMFGEGGYEKFVDQVAKIEQDLGIYDLRQFTPKVSSPG